MKMAHVTIFTDCLDESVAFYQSVVGLEIVRDLRDQQDHKVVFLSDGQGSTCVELAYNPEGKYSGSGLFLGFALDGADAYREKLQAEGYGVSEMVYPNPKARFFFVKDPNGVDVQFVQEDE